jgi:hypothetical protein
LGSISYIGSYTAEAYSNALLFLRSLIRLGANPRSRLEDITAVQPDEERGNVVDVDTRSYLRDYFKKSWAKDSSSMAVDGKEEGDLQVYLQLIEGALKADETGRWA